MVYWIQIIASILETLGFALAFLEFRFPLKADLLEEFIDGMEGKLKVIGYRNSQTVTFEVIMSISILAIALLVVPTVLSKHTAYLDMPELPDFVWFLFWICIGFVSYVIGVMLLSDFIRFLNKIDRHDRATGSLGFILGGIGIILDFTQYIL